MVGKIPILRRGYIQWQTFFQIITRQLFELLNQITILAEHVDLFMCHTLKFRYVKRPERCPLIIEEIELSVRHATIPLKTIDVNIGMVQKM